MDYAFLESKTYIWVPRKFPIYKSLQLLFAPEWLMHSSIWGLYWYTEMQSI